MRLRLSQMPYRLVGAARSLRAHRDGIRTIGSFEELDPILDQAAELFQRSNQEALALLSTIRLASPSDLPDDPHGGEYRERQLQLYRDVSGLDSYEATTAEVSELTSDAPPRSLYPYATGNPHEIGEHLVAAGVALQLVGGGPGTRVVEYGPGWGVLTVRMALAGYEVTAVDLNPWMLDVIQRQAARSDVQVATAQADMVSFTPESPADVAVFYESFHHCFDFPRLLDHLRDTVLGPDGRIVLIGEPISHQDVPWGLRLDGLSLWSVRREGWMELGFATSFFTDLVERHGWKAEFRPHDGQRASAWVLERA